MAKLITRCPDCGSTDLGWISQRFGHCRRSFPGIKVKDRSGYHPGLARFPNDPEAHVGGDDSLQRLVTRRKHQGWVEPDLSGLGSSSPRKKTEREKHEEIKKVLDLAEKGGAFDPNRSFDSLEPIDPDQDA